MTNEQVYALSFITACEAIEDEQSIVHGQRWTKFRREQWQMFHDLYGIDIPNRYRPIPMSLRLRYAVDAAHDRMKSDLERRLWN